MITNSNIRDENLDMGPPQEGAPNVGKYFFEKFRLAKQEKDRLNMHSKWLKNSELKRGEHFKHGNFSITINNKSYPLVPVNLHHKVIAQTKANLTDNKPKFEIIGHSDIEKSMAPVFNAAAEFWWKQRKQQKRLAESVDKSETYGTSIEKAVFDPNLEGGLGDIDFSIRDPYKIFPWPGVQDIQKMPFFFDVDVLELVDIRRLWPETGMMVQADREWSTLLGKKREELKGGTLSRRDASSNLPINYVEGKGPQNRPKIPRALIIECWCKDYTMVDEEVPVPMMDELGQPIIDELGQPIVTTTVVKKPKYPGFIRKVAIANQGEVVLDDMSNPSINPNLDEETAKRTYLWDKYPYLKNDAISSDVGFWGYSIIEQLEVLVKEINRKVSMIAAYIDKTVKPPLIVPKNAGIKKKDIHNLPGMVLMPANHLVANAIRAVQMPSLPSDYFNFIEFMMRLVDIISGIQDVTEGRKPGGIAAASAIIALQEKAETIFRDKIRNLDMLLEERGRMWISHSQNWYTEERTIRTSGKYQEMMGSEFVNFRGTDMQGEFSFDVVSGSTMPKSMFARREQALQLAQFGWIDQKALLEEFDFPNAEQIIQRMQAGPIGMMLERLAIAMELGQQELNALNLTRLSEEDLITIQNILSLDDKEFEKIFVKKPPVQGGVMKPIGQTPPGNASRSK